MRLIYEWCVSIWFIFQKTLRGGHAQCHKMHGWLCSAKATPPVFGCMWFWCRNNTTRGVAQTTNFIISSWLVGVFVGLARGQCLACLNVILYGVRLKITISLLFFLGTTIMRSFVRTWTSSISASWRVQTLLAFVYTSIWIEPWSWQHGPKRLIRGRCDTSRSSRKRVLRFDHTEDVPAVKKCVFYWVLTCKKEE